MTDIEPILAHLAGPAPRPPAPGPLQARARRRARIRRGATVAVAVVAVGVAVVGGAALVGNSEGSDLGTADAPPGPTTAVTTPTSTPAPTSGTPTSAVPPTGAEDAGPSSGPTDVDPGRALEAMNALDQFLTLVAAGQHQQAARQWEPVWSGELSGDEAAARLAEHCGEDGCRHWYELLAARRLGPVEPGAPDRYEVLIATDTQRSPHAQVLTEGDATVPWVVTELPPAGESGDLAAGVDGLFEPLGPDRPSQVTVARSTHFETWYAGQGSGFFDVGRHLFDLWMVNGWLHGEGRWVMIDQPLVCEYGLGPDGTGGVPGVPISIFQHEGRWITELVELGDIGSTARPAHWWDCEAGAEVDIPDLPHSRVAEETEEVLVSNGRWITAASSATGPVGSVLRRPDGSAISEDRVAFPVFDGATSTVAYVLIEEVDGGTVGREVVVRSVETGDQLGRWAAPSRDGPASALPVIHLDYDGRFVVAIHGPADYRPVAGAWDLDRHYTIADVTTGATHSGLTPVAWIWLD